MTTLEPAMDARLRLASLWVSQTARVLADNCLRMVVVLHIVRNGSDGGQASWHLANVFFILPFLLLAPINGAISNGLPKRWVLVGASAYSLAVGLGLWLAVDWDGSVAVWCAGLTAVALGAAIYSPARYGMLPAVAQDTHVALPRINGWIEAGGSAAIVLGLAAGGSLDQSFPTVVLLAGLVALVAALPAAFPSDVCRPEPAGQAVAGFFRDLRRIVRDPAACGSMFGMATFYALILCGAGAILAHAGALRTDADPWVRAVCFIWVGVGAASGSYLASLQGHPRRSLGLVPFAAIGTLLALGWAVIAADLVVPSLLLGMMGGLINVPLRAAFQAAVPADARGNAMAVSNAVSHLIGISAALACVAAAGYLASGGQVAVVAGLACLAAVASWRFLARDAVELVVELTMKPMYRLRSHGPGLAAVPAHGAALIIANHTAWLDPLWLGKILPRRIYPLMTSDFYDLPGLRWLLKHVFHVVRVQASSFRRDAPELQDAIARLDKEDFIAIFPEGWMRRRPEPSVRMFGQGVWRILQERPQTPVIACWIEGGWGSFTSYAGGKPAKNKRLDFRRPIDVAISEPAVVPAEILNDSRATRLYLMRACLQARGHLGLEVPPLPKMNDLDERETVELGSRE